MHVIRRWYWIISHGPAAPSDWVHRYNADRIAGLEDRHGGGVKRRLSTVHEVAVADWMRTGPDVAEDKVVRWRCVDIQARSASGPASPCTSSVGRLRLLVMVWVG